MDSRGTGDLRADHGVIGLIPLVDDVVCLEQIVDEVLAANAAAVEEARAGGKKSGKARGFLLGQVMQKTQGQANPKVVSEILGRKLG